MSETGGALAGIRVVDLTRVLGGPYCTQILGDHGASVIKVEPPQGDETRDWGPPFRDSDHEAAYFVGVNRNKRSIGLDLAKPEGRAVLMRLLENADVLTENFKPGTLEKWGIGYHEVLAEKFPRLIHCRVTGFGADGPLGGFPGYDAVIQAMTGMLSVNGSPEGGAVRVGTPMVDMGTGLNAAIAILMAIIERQRSGRGQSLDITLYDCAVALLHPQGANYLMSGKAPVLTGNAHPNIYPYDVVQAKDKPIFLAVGNNGQFAKLCAAIGAPEIASDPRYASNAERSTHRATLKPALEEKLAAFEAEPLTLLLSRQGVPAGPVNTVPEALSAAHTLHRGMRVSLPGTEYEAIGIPAKLSRTPGSVRVPAPLFGSSSRLVLREAGYAEDEIEALLEGGILLETRRTL